MLNLVEVTGLWKLATPEHESLQSANQRPLELLGVTSVEVVCSDLLQIET